MRRNAFLRVLVVVSSLVLGSGFVWYQAIASSSAAREQHVPLAPEKAGTASHDAAAPMPTTVISTSKSLGGMPLRGINGEDGQVPVTVVVEGAQGFGSGGMNREGQPMLFPSSKSSVLLHEIPPGVVGLTGEDAIDETAEARP